MLEDRGFEVVDYDFILNTIQVWNRTTFFSTSSPLVVAGYLLVLYQYGGCLSPCMFCLVWMANTERTAH